MAVGSMVPHRVPPINPSKGVKPIATISTEWMQLTGIYALAVANATCRCTAAKMRHHHVDSAWLFVQVFGERVDDRRVGQAVKAVLAQRHWLVDRGGRQRIRIRFDGDSLLHQRARTKTYVEESVEQKQRLVIGKGVKA